MKTIKILIAICMVACPQWLFAAEKGEHRYTPKEQIHFTPATLLAFDHSGKNLSHSRRADGSSMASHNGSMGNVTVARLAADGSIETFCTTDETAARAWMAGEDGHRVPVSLNLQSREK